MFKKFTTADKLLFISAFLSLIFSEILYFKGEANAAIFIGIWVPSILAFGIYLKLVNNSKNDWNNTIFRRPYYTVIRSRLFIGVKSNAKVITRYAACGSGKWRNIYAGIFCLTIKINLIFFRSFFSGKISIQLNYLRSFGKNQHIGFHHLYVAGKTFSFNFFSGKYRHV